MILLIILGGIVMFGAFLALNRAGGKSSRNAALQRALQPSNASAASPDLEFAEARAALASVYEQHKEALVDEIRRLMAPDRYGRRDEEAAAREFSAFQKNVAIPAVSAMGHPLFLIEDAFEADKEALIAGVLKAV